MPSVNFTSHLFRYFPDLNNGLKVEGRTVAEVVAALDDRFPGLGDYIVDESGALRKHVNVFIGDTMIEDRQRLLDAVNDDKPVFIFQALSGG